jgi:hypothetical protein
MGTFHSGPTLWVYVTSPAGGEARVRAFSLVSQFSVLDCRYSVIPVETSKGEKCEADTEPENCQSQSSPKCRSVFDTKTSILISSVRGLSLLDWGEYLL